MSLKENCKERIFSVIKKITEISKYIIMVVDKNCYNILSIVSKNEELLENGVSLIELINSNRNELPDFDCIYFLSPKSETVNIMLNDFKEENNCKYKNVYIIFISSIKKNDGILDLIASNDIILKRIKSCACLNLNFLPYESRIFSFPNKLKLYDYYPLKNTKILYDLSAKLVSVCSCLKTWPYIRYQNSELCKFFAETFYNDLNASDLFKLNTNEITNKKYINKNNTNETENSFFESTTNEQNEKNRDKTKITTNSDLVLILDRSIDSSILFLHDYSYQSLCYDLLKIETEYCNIMEETDCSYNYDYNKNKNEINEPHTVTFDITNSDKNKEKKKAILTEDDELWLSYRHIHIQEVNEIIKNKITTFTEKNTVAKIKKKNVLNPNEALEALRSLPQYESMIEQYWLHVYLCDSCFKILQNKNIVSIGLIEQDISCNVDKYGKELNLSKNNANLISIITSNEYEEEDKARLILLYFINYININEYDKNKIIDLAQLSLFMRKFINEFLKLNIHLNYIYLDENLNHSNKVYHILDKNKKKIKNYKNIAKNSKYELSRHEPNIKEIILNIYEQNLNKSQFPYVGHNIYDENNEKKKTPTVSELNVYRGTVWEFNTPYEQKHSEENQKNKLIQNRNSGDSATGNNTIISTNISSSNNNKNKKKKIIIFIIGGITYPEIKYVYEMSKELNLDIYLGGTSLLTSNLIFKQFKMLSNF
uniref:Syntaxin binding protein n=1 Tax=Piliocolobus tephrosceles TaxID=591936 RepID=A0A8C9GER1_9PRIM